MTTKKKIKGKTSKRSGQPRALHSGRWFDEAKRIIVYRIGAWREQQGNPKPIPGFSESDVRAYCLGRWREAEAMIDLLSAINRGDDVTWAAPSSSNNPGQK